jgi:hypothetical protein
MVAPKVGFKTIKDIFDNAGYTVSFGPTEKLAEGEISLRLKDMDIIIEDPYIYHLWLVGSIGFQMMDPDVIPAKVIEIVKLVEEHIFLDLTLNRGNFKFVNAKAKQSGEMYQIELAYMFREMVTIDQ